jgi:hypothetical protein
MSKKSNLYKDLGKIIEGCPALSLGQLFFFLKVELDTKNVHFLLKCSKEGNVGGTVIETMA